MGHENSPGDSFASGRFMHKMTIKRWQQVWSWECGWWTSQHCRYSLTQEPLQLVWLSSYSLHRLSAVQLAGEASCWGFPLVSWGMCGSGCMSADFPGMIMWCEEGSFRLIRPGLLWSAWLSMALRTACGQLDPLSFSLTMQTWSSTHKHSGSGLGLSVLSMCLGEVCKTVSSEPVSLTRIQWKPWTKKWTGFNCKKRAITCYDCINEVR